MGINYSVTALRNPLRPEEDERYYAKAQIRSIINMRTLSRELAYATSLTEGDVYNVLVNLPYGLKKHLDNGDMVDLGELGKFQYQISSEGATTRSEFTYHKIKKVKFHFRPSKFMIADVKKLEFEEVISREEMKVAKRQAKNK